MNKHMKDVLWHVAGIGFGVRGSQISDVITLFEGQQSSLTVELKGSR
jgi:hypothetical protein